MSATLPVSRAAELAAQPAERRWLVEDLWLDEAVGILGGEPKCCKSFLALDLAVSVAAGVACLRTYRCRNPGPVLLFAAEDALHVVRERLAGICRAAGVTLADLEVFVVTAPTVRLDLAEDRARLAATVADFRPRLLVLDPFVRLHRVDENASAFVAPMLAYLRELQREHHCAVVVVHHARKGAGRARPGQALRGSSEFHSWGDSNLYLRRTSADSLVLDVEHRAAPGTEGVALRLAGGAALALRPTISAPVQQEEPEASGPEGRIVTVLGEEKGALAFAALRKRCGGRAASFGAALRDLVAAGRVGKGPDGYFLLKGEG